MLHELRTYTLVPGGVREYLRLYNDAGRTVQTELLGNLVSLMYPESGDLNQLVYLWAFEDFEDRRQRRARLMADERFTAFRKSVRHLLVRQESQLMTPA
ncbi:NIPSNAP family protein [Hydrogenophaga sp. 5NK40-0174]|uniref:NIPSNAP family protein n=1 Tax=Hydrogenophaga sp. 5NK40-0174 TaxID=3127649 RepID=UPI003340DBEF